MVQTKKEIPTNSIIIFVLSLMWTFFMLFFNVDTGEFSITPTKVFIMVFYTAFAFATILLGGNPNLFLKIWEVLKDTSLTPEEKMRRIELIIIEAVSVWNAINQANPPPAANVANIPQVPPVAANKNVTQPAVKPQIQPPK